MPSWDPAQYLRFADHRLRPAADLIARIPDVEPDRVWDLGCGPGGPTMLLHARWPHCRIEALDSSAEMLAAAPVVDRITWVEGDIGTWVPGEPPDLVFSNAALHWLDDHEGLFPRLLASLRPGGVLAVQMPRNDGEPSHSRLRETAHSQRWASRVGHLVRDVPVLAPHRYHEILRSVAVSIDLWETVYHQELTGPDAVATWTKGSAVRPYLDVLGPDGEDFFADYSARLADDYPVGPDGVTLFPFRRLFLIATV